MEAGRAHHCTRWWKCCKAFSRAFGTTLVELRTELRAELNVLKFVTWILPQFTARGFVFNQLKVGLAKFEI